MSRPLVLVTRPRPQAEELAAILEQDGAVVLIDPVLKIAPAVETLPDLSGMQAILLTSPNGVRVLAAATAVRDVPVFTVGDASAVAARQAGFTAVTAAAGDAVSLITLIRARLSPADGPLWHGRGANIAHDLVAELKSYGFDITSTILYTAEMADCLAPTTVHHLRVGDVQSALFFSPRTALTFTNLVRSAGLEDGVRRCVACALSAKVAKALAGLSWADVRIARQSSQPALLAVWRESLGTEY